jgi:hypothetical protein
MRQQFEQIEDSSLALQEGEMTQVTDGIRELAEKIGGEDREFLANACMYLKQNFHVQDKKPYKPDKMRRTADQILIAPATDAALLTNVPEGKRPIGTCTEWGKALRALCLAKEIPTLWVVAVTDDWVHARDEASDPNSYDDHVFLDVQLQDGWMTLNTTAHPGSKDGWLWKRENPPRYEIAQGPGHDPRVYHPVAWGLDHTKLWAADGQELSFHSKKEWHVWVNHAYPQRMQLLERLPEDY